MVGARLNNILKRQMIGERVHVWQQVRWNFKLGLVHIVNAYLQGFIVEILIDAMHFFLIVIGRIRMMMIVVMMMTAGVVDNAI